MTKLSRKKIREAIIDSAGVKSVVAKRCGVSRQAITLFFQKPRNSDLLHALKESNEQIIDLGEVKLYKMIDDEEHRDHFKSVKHLLETKGKDRGFTKKQEIDIGLGSDFGKIGININIPEEVKELLYDNRHKSNNKTGTSVVKV